ncbi:MAG TPA: APC family permease [Chitinophagaceae bacterium]|nr:APC family permease [Chitinophagaceae bacterium]
MIDKQQKPIEQLKRTLTLRDLVLFNLVTVISLTSLAIVANSGIAGLTLLIIGAIFFFIPQGLAVNELSSNYPEEGGIYAWTKLLLGNGHGFLCGWCYWINNVLFYPTSVMGTAVIATYVINKSNSTTGSSLTFILPFTLVALWLAAILNMIGMKKGKWLQNIGAICNYIPFIILAILGIYTFVTHSSANSFAAINWKLDFSTFSSLNLWAVIPFAYAGLELSATLGNEIKDPTRNLPRSVLIAAPFIALFYLVGSGSLLYIVPKESIDVIGGAFQAINISVNRIDNSLWWIASLAAAFAAIGRIGGLGAWITGSARVAFVVGLDKYFPPAFGRIHPRWHTPHIAILIQTILATIFLLMAILGKGTTVEAAFLILLDMSIILYFIPYVYLFICFLKHYYQAHVPKVKMPFGKTGAIIIGSSGLMITFFAMFVAMIPPPGTNPWLFEIKVIAGSLILILLGGYFYRRGNRLKSLT